MPHLTKPADQWGPTELAHFQQVLAGGDGGSDAEPPARAVGLQVEDAQGRVGVIVEDASGIWFQISGTGDSRLFRIPFEPGNYKLGNGKVITLDRQANVFDVANVPTAPGGTGRRSIAEEIRLLEAQAAIARREGDHAREADFLNQIEILKLNQEFQSGENVLSRENQVRLQRLSDLSSLQRQILSDKARGRELLVEMIGKDPIRAGALAQGLVPKRGTPADLFRTELQGVVDQPLIQPASQSISDINTAITQTQEQAGLPTPPAFTNTPIPSAAHGAVIDMTKKNGQFRILVGDQGPELIEGDRNQIQITPIASAAHGGRISFTESPFNVPGFRSGPRAVPRATTSLIPRPIAQSRIPLSAPGGVRTPTQASAAFQVPQDVQDRLDAPRPTPAGAPSPPLAPVDLPGIGDIDFAPTDGTQIVQGLESIFDFLGFSEVPTFTEGEFGGMRVPAGGLGALNALGINPSLLRVLGSPGTAENFFVTPSGELQSLGGGGLLGQNLGLARAGGDFRAEDFLTIDRADLLGQGFSAGDLSGASPFTGQPLASASDPFPTPRVPLTIPSEVTGGAGVFLPDPRTLAPLFSRLAPSVRRNLLSAFGLSDTSVEDVLRRIDFFSAQGTFNPSQIAGFG